MSTYIDWYASTETEMRKFVSTFGDNTKIEELMAEFKDHSEIVRISSPLLLGEQLENERAWDVGAKRARYNAMTRGWIAPRNSRDIKNWVVELFEAIVNNLSLDPIQPYLAMKTFTMQVQQLWNQSRWYETIPAPLETKVKGKVEHNAFKEGLELGAINTFLEIYNTENQHGYRLVKLDDKPDAIIATTTDDEIGVEIVHIYYDPHEAKLLKGETISPMSTLQSLSAQVDHRPSLLDTLNKEITKKVQKRQNYAHFKVVCLLIRIISPIFGVSDFNRHLQDGDIKIPTEIFDTIWLLAWEDGSTQLLTLT
jgi:hypothetical protein